MIVLSDSQYYSDIANAIRAKNGENTQYKPSEMALAIKSLQGGGINCTLTISTVPNATVTATFENQTVTAIADVSGTAVLELSKEGVWTVTATYEGETVSTQVDTSFSVTTELSFVDPILANNTWEQISKVAREGKAATLWNVGDTKSFVMDGVTYKAQIVGFDHYDVADPTAYGREKAGILFQFEKTTTSSYQMNSTDSTTGGYIAMKLCSTVEGFINSIESDLSNVIQQVSINYLSKYNATSASSTKLKIFLPTEFEIFGENVYAPINIGEQYPFYAAGNSPIKTLATGSTKKSWWLRSLRKSSSTNGIVVYTSGNSYTQSVRNYASVAPVFCL